jgi:hypothetical protein
VRNTNFAASEQENLAGFLLSHRCRLPFAHEVICHGQGLPYAPGHDPSRVHDPKRLGDLLKVGGCKSRRANESSPFDTNRSDQYRTVTMCDSVVDWGMSQSSDLRSLADKLTATVASLPIQSNCPRCGSKLTHVETTFFSSREDNKAWKVLMPLCPKCDGEDGAAPTVPAAA